ncbi:MAG: amidohydrolase [Proteobacteria bacterium]|nr:amidohydrolase [Pseudomonadota bacterium]
MRFPRLLTTLGCLFALTSSSFAAPASPAPVEADAIFTHGTVLPIQPAVEAQALAIRGGQIVAVGTESAIARYKGPSTKIVDLKGKTIMPGFVEPHTHIDVGATNLAMVQCGSEQPGGLPRAQTIARLKAAVTKVPAGGWLLGNGFDPSRTTPLWADLSVHDLDGISTTVPILVLNASGHIAYVNHRAYALAGITDKTPNPPSGRYGHDKQGHLDGRLYEPTSYTAFMAKVPTPSPQELRAQFLRVYKIFNASGVTTVGDLNTGAVAGVAPEVAILRSLAAEAPVRVRCYLAYIALQGKTPPVKPFEGDDKLKFIGLKLTMDGSTQGFTAALTQPYLHTSDKGELDWPSLPKLLASVKPYFDAGWQFSCHANGDRALDQGLALYGELTKNLSPQARANRRLRIEHFTVNRPEQVKKAAELGTTVSMTIGHVYFWGRVFNDYVLGAARAARIDPAAALLKQGVKVSFHSDYTITSVSPLRYMMTAINRTPQQNPPQVLGREQGLTIDQALRAVTIDAAWQMFIDDKVGSLEPGKYADLVVLDQNPRKVDPSKLASIGIKAVYLAGKRVR